MKFCGHCKRDLPRSEFGRNKSTRDGLAIYCRPCRREKARAWRAGLTPEERAARRAERAHSERVREERARAEDRAEALQERAELLGDLSGAHGGPAFNADPSASSDIRDAEEDALLGYESAARFLRGLRWPVPPLLESLLPPGFRMVRAGDNRVHVRKAHRARVLESVTPRAAALWAIAYRSGWKAGA